MGTPKIDKKTFVDFMTKFQKLYKEKDLFADDVYSLLGDADGLIGVMFNECDLYIDTMNYLLDDKREKYKDKQTMLDWYFFDTRCGEEMEPIVKVSGQEICIKDFGDLYDVITIL